MQKPVSISWYKQSSTRIEKIEKAAIIHYDIYCPRPDIAARCILSLPDEDLNRVIALPPTVAQKLAIAAFSKDLILKAYPRYCHVPQVNKKPPQGQKETVGAPEWLM